MVVRHFENNINTMTPHMAETLNDALDEYPIDWIIEAFDIAVEANVRKWKYVEGILKNWNTNGKDSGRKKVSADAPAARV